ncbi:MAG: cytochrome c biogenesis protein CcdA [Candidatus Wildermuthbacteria bacterium]|nr:cytochrome c biogenesis protein CcdA [Candidatus Wildermuthbacteria bacterium]
MSKKLFILIALSVLLFGIFLFFRFSGSGTSALWNLSNGGTWLLPLVAVSALIDSINPCAFSILILTIAFLFSIGKLRSKILLIGGVYILGIFLVYLFIGLGILQTLHFFNTPHFMAKVGAFLLIAFGAVSLINEFFPAFPIKLRIPHAAHQKMAELVEKGSILTAFLLGGLVGLCEFPCTGGPYLMVLGLLHDQATYLKGLGYLILYNLIFVLPLALILSIGSNKALLDKVQSWQREKRILMRFGGGIAMIALGFAIFFL